MTKRDFSQRSVEAELMDDTSVTFEEFRNCLRDLEIVNRCTLAQRPTLHWLKRASRAINSNDRLSILDVGSGGGGMLRRIANWARKNGRQVDLVGVDLNPWSKRSAEQLQPSDVPIRFETSDIFTFETGAIDFIISSLFTHHLADSEVVRFLRWMDRRAVRGWFINDLHRHPLPSFVIKHATRLLRFDRMVQYDGPLSVARAFTARDWRRLLAAAGIPAERTRIAWYFPFRYCVAGWKT
ncbi:MAG: methyltransferase domain-containing protein [Candidatus Binataceae bacterium]